MFEASGGAWAGVGGLLPAAWASGCGPEWPRVYEVIDSEP